MRDFESSGRRASAPYRQRDIEDRAVTVDNPLDREAMATVEGTTRRDRVAAPRFAETENKAAQ